LLERAYVKIGLFRGRLVQVDFGRVGNLFAASHDCNSF
jgi:hypothetical protein